jgi:cytochrome c oxidase subunit 3
MTTSSTITAEYRKKLATNRLGLWLFLISDSFVFGGLLITRFYLLGTGHRPDVNPLVGVTVTAVLLLSSFFMNRAEIAMAFGDSRTFQFSILITLILGLIFLTGVLGVEWRIAPFGPGDGAAASVFYTMTGFHAFHVLSGLLFLAVIFRNGRKGLYSPEKHWAVEAGVVYWHFVDVVWVFFYTALYLIGSPLI